MKKLCIFSTVLIIGLTSISLKAQTGADYYLPLCTGNYVKLYTDGTPSGWAPRNTFYSIIRTDSINGKLYHAEKGIEIWDSNPSDTSVFHYFWLRKDSAGNILAGAYDPTGTGNLDSAIIIDPPWLWFPNQFLTLGYSESYSTGTNKTGTDSVISVTATAGTYSNCIQIRSTNRVNGVVYMIEDVYYAYHLGRVKGERLYPNTEAHTDNLVAYLATNCYNAQIPNPGFETWVIYHDYDPPYHPYETPVHWHGSLPTSPLDSAYSIEKNFDSYPTGSGQYSMIVKSNEDPFGSHGVAASFDSVYQGMWIWKPSFPINYRLNSFCLYYKYNPVGGDSAVLKCLFFKNGIQIGDASDTVMQNISDWTQVSIPVKFNTSDVPDSATIYFFTYLNVQHTGSKLYVDNLSFDCVEISGTITDPNGNPVDGGNVYLFNTSNLFGGYDTTDVTTITNGNFTNNGITNSPYILLAFPDSSHLSSMLPTYYRDTIYWMGADTIITSVNLNLGIISFTPKPPPLSGNATISGRVVSNLYTKANDPIDNVGIILKRNSKGSFAGYTLSDANGLFSFKNVEVGNYSIFVDYPGIRMYTNSGANDVSVVNPDDSIHITARVDSAFIRISGNIGIFSSSPKPDGIMLYPNPTSGKFTLTFENPCREKVTVSISSIEGRMIYSSEFIPGNDNNFKKVIDLQNLVKGIYIVKTQTKQRAEVKSLIVN